jgi:hypothetical protein
MSKFITLFRMLVIASSLVAGGMVEVRGQTSTSVENLTSVPSTTIRQGLGFNMGSIKNEWEFQMAAAAGSTEARFQPGWVSVENTAGGLALPAADETALNWCSTYGIKPLLVAGYGPPYHSLGTFTVAQAYPIGTTTIHLNQSVAKVNFPYCHVMTVRGQIVPERKWGYYGALITGADSAANTITLAAATNVALTAGETLVINQLLYPSCATASPTDPSIIAYGKYAAFLAGRIAAHGLTGRVELWNEPAWAHDPWDHRGAFYDKPPAGVNVVSPNFGIAENLAPTMLPPGVRYNWGGTNKSGGRSVLNPSLMSPPLTVAEVANSIACEAIHPYGNSPEEHLWDPTLLASATIHNLGSATLPGASWGSNMKEARWFNLQNPSLNFKQNVTETGTITADNLRKARFEIRQYLGLLADGMERVTFYCFATPGATDGSTKTFGFVDEKTKAPTQAYTAIRGLVMTDMADMPLAPVAYTAADLPTVPSYSGTYPLTTMSIVGRHAKADTKNIVDYVVWQRSLTPPGPVTNLAVTSASGPVTLTWRSDYYTVTNTVERATTSGGPYTKLASGLSYSKGNYKDSSVSSGLTYYYIVVGDNPAGAGSNSNEVSATVGAPGTGGFNNDSKPAGAAQLSWLKLASPSAAQVTAQLPDGYRVRKAWNLVTRAKVPLKVSGSTATYAVADDPVCLEIAPAVVAK